MKAVEFRNYGAPSVLQLVEVQEPEPAQHEILIKVHATTVTATESLFRRGESLMARMFTGLLKPRLKKLGEELSGTIMAVGAEVKEFKVGDHVFGTAGPEFGANAEFICLDAREAVLVTKPDHISFCDAASTVDGFLTALPFLRDVGKLKPGQRVFIYGASGSVGSAAVQLAKLMGAHVSACCSTANLEWVSALGADHVLDYTTTDITRQNQTYDLVFDTVGKLSFLKSKAILKPGGVFLEAGIRPGMLPLLLWNKIAGGKRIKIAATGMRKPADRLADLKYLQSLLADGSFKPVVDRTYALTEIAEAHAYVDQGHKKGNVVIKVA